MKKLCVVILALIVAQSNLFAEDKAIEVNQLPQTAQKFITDHFSGTTVAMATVDNEMTGKEYTVRFADGSKVEFDKKGEWSDVECKQSAVPAAIVPSKIMAYVTKIYPNAKILQIDRDKQGYDVEIPNGVDLKFDPKGKFIRMDD